MNLNDLLQTADAKRMFCIYQRRRAVTRGLSLCLNFFQEGHFRQGHEQPYEQCCSLNLGLLLQAGQYSWEYFFFLLS